MDGVQLCCFRGDGGDEDDDDGCDDDELPYYFRAVHITVNDDNESKHILMSSR